MIVTELFKTWIEKERRKEELIFEKDNVSVWNIFSNFDSVKNMWYIQYYKREV